MASKYILDLEKAEYRDDFVSNENNQFWQFEARDSLIEKLTTTLNEAKEYKIARQKESQKTWLSHNAILVSGQRGTGKTVFLRNCKDIWGNNKSTNATDNQNDLYFLNEIDPTMLINEDNFSNVVVAQIYSAVERKLQSENSNKSFNVTLDNYKNIFYKALKKLADSLGKQDDFNGLMGIDKIQQYKSGIHIQVYFHEFIEAAIDILGCDALVLPIDDVDMALDRAFEVVDDVRRLLGCPYIIPIVSGDYRLYTQMTNVHFDEKSYRDKSDNLELKDEGKELAKQLSNAYLTKIFPNQMRITLLPILYITPTLTIKQKYKGVDSQTLYKDYTKKLLEQFYPLCYNKEVLDNWPEPESARELTQLIRAMPPSKFKSSFNENRSKLNVKLWKNYLTWADLKQDGVAFTNASSYLSLVNRDPSALFDIQELPNFNPKQQMIKELYPWAKKDFYHSQLSALGFLNSSNDEKLPQFIKDNKTVLDSVFNKSSLTLRSMPPLEFIDKKSYVPLATIATAISEAEEVNTAMFISNESNQLNGNEPNNESIEGDILFKVERILFDLYTHGDVYSTLQNNYQYVFMSRAYEVIFYSFMNDFSAIRKVDLEHILTKTPFYSVFNMASTKAILSEESEENLSINNGTSKEGLKLSEGNSAEVLSKLIKDWKLNHSNFFENFEHRLLIPIFTYMFNKTFTSFNAFKQKVFSKSSFGNKSKTNENLTDFAKRFEYMLINSAYTASIKGVAVQANTAFTDNHKTIRSVDEFNRTDRVLTRNRDRLKDTTADLFIKALESHPIFKLIQKKDENGSVIIPEKFKMGNNQESTSDIYRAVKVLLEEVTPISKGGIKKVSTFQERLKSCDSNVEGKVNNFYRENKDSLQEIYNNSSKEVQGNKEHNFIIALIKSQDKQTI